MKAFVLRIAPSGIDRVPQALETNDLIIGWSRAGDDLLNDNLGWNEFRQIIHDEYYSGDETYRSSGAAAGNLWRFIREMSINDLVVVLHGNKFHVAEVAGPARHEPERVEEDTAFRRSIKWLNDGEPIPRRLARAALQSRMKIRQTCARATNLISAIKDALRASQANSTPSFDSDLRQVVLFEKPGYRTVFTEVGFATYAVGNAVRHTSP